MSQVAKKLKVEKASKDTGAIAALSSIDMPAQAVIRLPSLSEKFFEAALSAKSLEERTHLLANAKELQSEEKSRAFWAAFADMQAELPVIERNGETENGRAYGLYEDIVPEINPVLKRFGFGLSFKAEDAPGAVLLTCILAHNSGHIISSSYPFPFDTTGEKNDNQSRVSAISYGKRALSTAMLNIVTRGQDDDAAASSAKTAAVSPEQITELKKLIAEAGRTEAVFLRLVAKVPTLAEIRAANFDALNCTA